MIIRNFSLMRKISRSVCSEEGVKTYLSQAEIKSLKAQKQTILITLLVIHVNLFVILSICDIVEIITDCVQ